MRSLFAILFLAVLTSPVAWSRSFELSTSPREQEFTPATDLTTFTVAITPVDGYSASVNFRIHAPTLPWVAINLSKTTINAPYNERVTVTIDPKSAHIPGRHMIVIEGANGPATSYDTCYLTVQPTRGWLHYNTFNSPLPSNNVRNMALDRNGIGWIVLENGLARFDKVNWTIFSINDLGDIPSGALAIDSMGAIWVGLKHGIARYHDGVWLRYSVDGSAFDITKEPAIQRFEVTSIAASANGTIWFLADRKLHAFDGSTWKEYGQSHEQIAVDRNGLVWLAHRSENISTFDGTFWSTNVVATPGTFRSFEFDPTGNLWIAGSQGIIKYDGVQRTFVGNQAFPGQHPATIDFDAQGNVWVGSADQGNEFAYGVGLVRYDGTTATRYTVYNSGLTDNRVNLVRAGSDGTIWMRTFAGGILLFNPEIASGVEREAGTTGAARIAGIHPNPAAGYTTVQLALDRRAHVRVSLHDALGREVRTALDEMIDAGEREITLNTEALPSGSYFVRIVAGDAIDTRMVTIAR